MNSGAINANTRISELIRANPLVIDTLAEFNPHFRKLKNPILRKLLAPRVSIADACVIGKCQLSDFFEKMVSIGFETEERQDLPYPYREEHPVGTHFANGLVVLELDVRPLLAEGKDPLQLILKSVKDLKTSECLKVINTFEPLPLINLLRKRGYQSYTERPDTETVHTSFIKGEKVCGGLERDPSSADRVSPDQFDQIAKRFGAVGIRTLDVREMEMPLPMLSILENATTLKGGEALFVHHKKVPVYLLPELKQRGFAYYIVDSVNGQVNMLICRDDESDC